MVKTPFQKALLISLTKNCMVRVDGWGALSIIDKTPETSNFDISQET